jgi:hypothetical protein
MAPSGTGGTAALDGGSDAGSIEAAIAGCVKLYGRIGAARLTVFCSRIDFGANLGRTKK